MFILSDIGQLLHCCPAATTAKTHEPVLRSNSLLAGGSRSADRSLEVYADHLAPGHPLRLAAARPSMFRRRPGWARLRLPTMLRCRRTGTICSTYRGWPLRISAASWSRSVQSTFGARPVEVALHGAHRHRESVGDVAIGQACGDKIGDLAFAYGQRQRTAGEVQCGGAKPSAGGGKTVRGASCHAGACRRSSAA